MSTEPSYAQVEWYAFLSELVRVGCELCDADREAHDHDDDDLRGWLDDLQDRVGLNVDGARVLLDAYINASNAAIARDVGEMDAMPASAEQQAITGDALLIEFEARFCDLVEEDIEIDACDAIEWIAEFAPRVRAYLNSRA